MLNCKRGACCILFVAGLIFLSGCRKSDESSTTASPAPAAAPAPAAPAKPERVQHYYGGLAPFIVSMSPETILVHDGHAPMQRFSLTYEIKEPEKATRAYVSVYVQGVGEVQNFDVDIKPQSQIEFLLDASQADLGPAVRFRIHCASSDSDWYTMGSDPASVPRQSPVRRITSVYPSYIGRGGQGEGGIPIEIRGEITRECTPQAQVDGSTVELQNVVVKDREIRGQLLYSDLQGRPVSPRHFEVKLVVEGSGMRLADSYNLNFSE